MKPTTESIAAGVDLALNIESAANTARVQLAMAKAFFEADASKRSVTQLECARSHLVNLRRTQMALLRNIDEAIASAKGGAS